MLKVGRVAKRALSVFMVMVLVVGLFPASALADKASNDGLQAGVLSEGERIADSVKAAAVQTVLPDVSFQSVKWPLALTVDGVLYDLSGAEPTTVASNVTEYYSRSWVLLDNGELWDYRDVSNPIRLLDNVAVLYSEAAITGNGTLYEFIDGQFIQVLESVQNYAERKFGSQDGLHAAISTNGSLYTWFYKWNTDEAPWTNTLNEPIKVLDDAKQVILGYSGQYFAVKNDGSLWSWGKSSPALGLGDGGEDISSPTKVMDGVASVYSEYQHVLALGTNGNLWSWGIGSCEESSSPILKLTDVTRVISSGDTSAVMRKDGSLWMWGRNAQGEIGVGTTESVLEPVEVLGDVHSAEVGEKSGYDPGGYCAAIKTDGSLWMWGSNYFCQLGFDSGGQNVLTPTRIAERISQVYLQIGGGKASAPHWTCALTDGGGLLAWGGTESWRAARSAAIDNPVITSPAAIMGDVQQASLAHHHGGAVKKDGSLWMWGNNNFGELGTGDRLSSTVPKKVLDDVAIVRVGDSYTSRNYGISAAVRTDGTLWVWGHCADGMLGREDSDDWISPHKVMDNVSEIQLNASHAFVIDKERTLWGWGTFISPTQCEYVTATEPVELMNDVVLARYGRNGVYSCVYAAVNSQGELYTWGLNPTGMLGNGQRTTVRGEVSGPSKILDDVVDVQVSGAHAYALTTDGEMYVWGGYSPRTSSDEELLKPVLLTDGIVAISANEAYAGAITATGKLLVWSDGGSTASTVANLFAHSTEVMNNAAGLALGCARGSLDAPEGLFGGAITKGGVLSTWGANDYGQLGRGWASLYQETPLLIAGTDKLGIARCSIDVVADNIVYDGTAKTPAVTVRDGSKILAKDTDYTVSYTDNVSAGSATVTVTGVGNYAGRATRQFPIAKAMPALSFASSSLSKALASGAFTNLLTKTTDGTVAFRSSNTSVATVDSATGLVTPKGTGAATITATAAEGANYKAGSASYTLMVTAAPSKFVWGKDNWSFHNCVNANYKPIYFKDGRYLDQINSTYRKRLEDNLNNTEYDIVFTDRYINGRLVQGWINEDWGGSCYGMSTLVLLAKNGLVPYSSYRSGATALNSLKAPKDDMNVSSLVTYYQMLQAKTGIRKEKTDTKKRSNEENIKGIISLLDSNSTVLVCFRKDWGHAVVAYGYEYGSWTKGGVTYNGRILICDPNRMTARSEDADIYFNTNSYSWAIPLYSADNVKSSKGAYIEYAGSDVGKINEGGYLSGSGSSKSGESIARLDTLNISDDRSVTKVKKESGEYMSQASGAGDIEEDYFFVDAGEKKGTPGYNLYDTDSAYRVTQDNPDDLALIMRYEDRLMSVGSAAGESAIFDRDGYVEISGESADYDLSITSNGDHPTNWFSLTVSGSGADKASLKMVDRGYVLEGDKLDGVKVEAHNRAVSARTSFSTAYSSAYIYEIDEGTIGVSVDTDGNGSFETVIADGSTAGASSGVSVGKVVDAINGIPDVSTLIRSDSSVVQAARKAYNSLTDAQKAQVGVSILKRLEEAEAKIADLERPAKAIDISKATITGLKVKTYTGKALIQSPVVKVGGKTLKSGTDYTTSYKNNKNAGTATVTVKGRGSYTGAKSATFKINKAANPMSAKAVTKTVKLPKGKKALAKATSVLGVVKLSKTVIGAVTYAKVSKGSAKCLSINKKTGKITVAKNTKAGTYKLKVTVKAAGDKNHKAKTQALTLAVKVMKR